MNYLTDLFVIELLRKIEIIKLSVRQQHLRQCHQEAQEGKAHVCFRSKLNVLGIDL